MSKRSDFCKRNKKEKENFIDYLQNELLDFEMNINMNKRKEDDKAEKIYQKTMSLLEEEYDINEENQKDIYWNISDYYKNNDLYSKIRFKIYRFNIYR
jgi:hypothetical protein